MSDTETRSEERYEAFMGNLFTSFVGTMELMCVHVGREAGLYDALRDGEATNAADLAQRAGIHPRYAREWLAQQAVAGVIDVVGANDDPDARTYRLPAEHADILLEELHPAYFGGATGFLLAASVLPAVVDAYKTGAGVPFGDFGDAVRDAQAGFNRPAFVNDLAANWLPAVPGLVERLQADPPARVADLGCGAGWSTIALAQGFPSVRVDGIDLDDASIADARKHAADAGVADRVTFEVRDAADPQLQGTYDLVTIFEAVHDMPRPVEVLRSVREMLAPGGIAIVMDEAAADEFVAPNDDLVQRLLWAVSPIHCLPVGMVGTDPVGTGTVMQTSTFEGYARDAGFGAVDVLPIEHPMFRFYRLEA